MEEDLNKKYSEGYRDGFKDAWEIAINNTSTSKSCTECGVKAYEYMQGYVCAKNNCPQKTIQRKL